TRAMLQTFEVLYRGTGRDSRDQCKSAGTHLLRATGLRKTYTQRTRTGRRRNTVTALDDVDLIVQRGSTLAIVGQSGCGKSTLGRCLAGLEKPDSGDIRTATEDPRSIQYIFQDAGAAMNPR